MGRGARELRFGLNSATVTPAATSEAQLDLGSKIGIQVVRTNILDVAVRIVELEKLSAPSEREPQIITDASDREKIYNHDLSEGCGRRSTRQ